MSWIKIPMKFPGTCIVCNEKIEINETGLWSKGLGVKHEKCAQTNELQCIVCNVNFRIFVIFKTCLNYAYVRNVVMKKMLFNLIKKPLAKTILF
jgi:hypothetical protein